MQLNLKQLTTSSFLGCLLLLLLNDFYLKAAFHNPFTGKLSDICGLFIFPIFWSVLFPRKKHIVYGLTALFFIYWKSSYSEPFIELFSQYIFPVQRTIDLTDLIALIVLPLSWYSQFIPQMRVRLSPYLAGLIALFSFCATSMYHRPRQFDQPEYVLFSSTKPLIDSNLVNSGLKIYNLDSLLAINVDYIMLGREPVRDDDFNKNTLIKVLEKDILSQLPDHYKILPKGQIHQLTIKTPEYQDEMTFRGSRLQGKFLRRHQGQILIDGQYKNGIEDSVWTFNDPSRNTSFKKTFKNGETTEIQYFTASKLTSSSSVITRRGTQLFKGFQLLVLLAFCTVIVVQLRKNHQRAIGCLAAQMKIGYKFLLVISLPLLSWLIQFIVWTIIPDHYSASFAQIANLFLLYVIGIPFFSILLFWLKPRKQTDILWYCILLALVYVFWWETIVLNLMFES